MKVRNFFRHMMITLKTLVFRGIELLRRYEELIRYGIFGVLTTLVDFGAYTVLCELLKINDVLSNALSWLLAVLFAFVTNKLFVFSSKERSAAGLAYEFGTFFAARAFTGLVYIGGFALLDRMGVNGYLSKAFLSVFNIVVNYIFSKLVIFRKKKAPSGNTEPQTGRHPSDGQAPRVRNGAVMIGGFRGEADDPAAGTASDRTESARQNEPEGENKGEEA